MRPLLIERALVDRFVDEFPTRTKLNGRELKRLRSSRLDAVEASAREVAASGIGGYANGPFCNMVWK